MRQAQDGPSDGGHHPGFHTVGPQMVRHGRLRKTLNGGPPAGLDRALNEPQPGFHATGPRWAFIMQVPARPSDGGPRPGFHMAGHGKAFIELRLRLVLRRQNPAGHSYRGLSPTLKWFAYAGPSDSALSPALNTADSERALNH